MTDLELLRGLVEEPDSSSITGLARLLDNNTVPPGFNDTNSVVKDNLKGVWSYMRGLAMNGVQLPAVQLSPTFAEHYAARNRITFKECLTPSGREALEKVKLNTLYTGACAIGLGMAYVGFKADFSGTLF